MAVPFKVRWFLLRFALLSLAFETLFFFVLANSPGFARYLELHARVVSLLLGWLGFQVEVHDATILLDGSTFLVGRGCDVTRPIGLLIAAILAFPARLHSKAMAIALGVLLLQSVNVVRIVSLILLNRLQPSLVDSVHLAVWPLFLALLILWFCTSWARRAVAVPSASTGANARFSDHADTSVPP